MGRRPLILVECPLSTLMARPWGRPRIGSEYDDWFRMTGFALSRGSGPKGIPDFVAPPSRFEPKVQFFLIVKATSRDINVQMRLPMDLKLRFRSSQAIAATADSELRNQRSSGNLLI